MADRNYISTDLANKLERARRRVQRTPQAHRAVPPPQETPTVSSLFRVYNNGSETIPEFGVMQVEELTQQYGEFSGETREAYAVTKPSSDGQLYMVNAGGEILAGHFGAGMLATEPTKILIDPAASPDFADRFGQTNGAWYVSTSAVGTLSYLGENDGETGIFEETQRALTSLVIGVTLSSTAAITGTVNSRPPGWSEVPGEVSGVVSITNPSSLALSSTGLSFHAAYCNRGDTNQWELVGGAGSGSATIAYGSLTNFASTSLASTTSYQAVPNKTRLVTEFGCTASTATYAIAVDTEGDYQIGYYAGGLALDSVGSTDFTAIFAIFKNSSGLSGFGCQVDIENSSGAIHRVAASAVGITHLLSGDSIQQMVSHGPGTILIGNSGLTVNLIRATTST